MQGNFQFAWRNDILGTGAPIKQGSSELGFSCNNSYTGDVSIEAGCLVAASAWAR